MNHTSSEDRGVRHTKERIKTAFLELLSQKPVHKITIRELVELADINRGTFYFHYSDIYDLLEQLETELYLSFEEVMTRPYTSVYQLLLDLLNLSLSQSQLISLLLGPTGDPSFIDKFENLMCSNLLVFWKTLKIDTESVKVQFFCTFLIQGFIGIVKEWLKNHCVPSAEELANYYANTIRASYHEFMDKNVM